MRCPNCGAENKKETLFCEICGAALPEQEKTPEDSPDSKQERDASASSSKSPDPEVQDKKISPAAVIVKTGLTQVTIPKKPSAVAAERRMIFCRSKPIRNFRNNK